MDPIRVRVVILLEGMMPITGPEGMEVTLESDGKGSILYERGTDEEDLKSYDPAPMHGWFFAILVSHIKTHNGISDKI